MEAFSDGVFAFAMTLLVLGLRDPTMGLTGSLLQGLFGEWPAFLAFGISFTTILVMWMNHHNLFTYVRRIDGPFMLLNGLLLLATTLIPFTTSLVADHIQFADSGTAAEVYSGIFLLVALAWNLLWQYASRHPGILASSVSDAEIKTTTRQFIFGPTLYVVAFAVAFFSGIASLAINLLVLAIYAFFADITPIGGRTIENAQS
ncbi:MAG TPA: TMEM175 family protein [Candidatus Angelobacter sp.]|nr:TMEM175 family protein [Candidatus Angelobacter sp.]